MYVKSLWFSNIRRLADRPRADTPKGNELSFCRGANARKWTVFVGENGTCKTTLLQMIALSLAGSTVANALQPEPRYMVRRDLLPADFGVEVHSPVAAAEFRGLGPETLQELLANPPPELRQFLGDRKTVYIDQRPVSEGHVAPGFAVPPSIHTMLGNPDANYVVQQIHANRRAGWFAVGYGTARRIARMGEVPTARDNLRERCAGLFEHGFVLRGVLAGAAIYERLGPEVAKLFADHIENLVEQVIAAFPQLAGAKVAAANGDPVEFSLDVPNIGGATKRLRGWQLAEGHQAMVAWVADLVGHYTIDAQKFVPADQMRGVVLVDEIDLHLHPESQRLIVPILRDVFPQLQFIVTTHSPLILTGFKPDEIVRLQVGADGLVHATAGEYPTALSTTSEILSTYFGVDRAARPSLMPLVRELDILLGYDKHTPEQAARLAELEAKLREEIGARES